MAAMYAVYHGPEGLRAIAARVASRAATLAAGLRAGGVEVAHDGFFDTVTAVVPGRAAKVVAAAERAGINLRLVDPDRIGVSCDEVTTPAHVAAVWAAFGVPAFDGEVADGLPAALRRTDRYLTHPVFHTHRSETAMLRYLRRLADKDYGLDRGMIPLGSCTMKLNATTEMEPVTWPEFAEVHPFAPAGQARGYRELIGGLERWLAELTGYDAVSVQPNAGSQGELAGLLAIHAHHQAAGQGQRDVCLIPSSAHGTNAASAAMAGMRVVVVACDADGNVDLADLDRKVAQHADRLAAIMVTYPSTHGVYEPGIAEVCAKVHDAGGQVYVDGANLNALLGFAKPGRFGADVSHLNLHKTFCIPHGGGGPGVGPVAVRAHLAPYLPAGVGDPDGPAGDLGGAVRVGGDPADLVGLPADDGSRRAGRRDRRGRAGRQLRGHPAARVLPGAVRRQPGPGGPRVHPRPAAADQGDRGHRGRRGQAPDRLRLPRADDVVPGAGDADGRADRVGGPGGAGPVRRRDDRDPRGDRQGRVRGVAGGGQPIGQRAAHGADGQRGRLGAPVPAPVGRVPGGYGGGQVLAAGTADRRGLRRPAPGLRLPGARGLRGIVRDQAAATSECGAGPRWGSMVRPSGSSSPVSSNRITPLHRRLHPCSQWVATTRAASRSIASAEGQGGSCWHISGSPGGTWGRLRAQSCVDVHMTSHARYQAQQRENGQVSPARRQNWPFG